MRKIYLLAQVSISYFGEVGIFGKPAIAYVKSKNPHV